MADSVIIASEHSTTFVGPDAIKLYRAVTLKHSIKMWVDHGIIPTRGVTITHMMKLATGYTGITYKRGPAGAAMAIEDLDKWINAMKAAIPIEQHPRETVKPIERG